MTEVQVMYDRYSRQRGLVRQSVVESLKVSTEGISDSLFKSLKIISEQLGVQKFPYNRNEADFVICGDSSTFKSIIIPEEKSTLRKSSIIMISYGGDGIFLDDTISEIELNSLYEPAVTTISSSLVWNEILRRSDAYLPVEVPKISVSINARVDEHSMLGPLDELDFALDGHKTNQNIRTIMDGTGQRRVMLRLSDDDPLSIELCNRLNIIGGRNNNSPCEPVIKFNLPAPQTIPKGHITIVGAGGLGTWVMKTMVEGLSNNEIGEIKILVFDGDMEVEPHNLNRQVIYSESDIGKPKVEAANEWLTRELPSAEIQMAFEFKDRHLQLNTSEPRIIPCGTIMPEEGGISFEELDDAHLPLNSALTQILSDDEIREKLVKTDVILGCLDAFRPRTLADLAAARLNQPYVNGGVQGLIATYCEFVDSSLVSKFGPQIATDKTIFSCQEDGEVPVASIVLSNALVGSFQAIAALQRLSGQKASSIQSVNWRLRTNEVWCVENVSTSMVSREDFCLDISNALWPKNTEEKNNSNPENLGAEKPNKRQKASNS